jgi:hypothetical protein
MAAVGCTPAPMCLRDAGRRSVPNPADGPICFRMAITKSLAPADAGLEYTVESRVGKTEISLQIRGGPLTATQVVKNETALSSGVPQ